jgi:single-strand DNA-binding protein
MLNRVILIGRLTADPELRYTSNSIAVGNFRLAVNRGFKNAQGEEETDFINIVVWRKQAENCKQYLAKGRLVAVEGALRIRTYQDKDGEKRWITEVEAENVRFLEWGDRPAGATGQSAPPPPDEPPPSKGSGFDEEDDDLPF